VNSQKIDGVLLLVISAGCIIVGILIVGTPSVLGTVSAIALFLAAIVFAVVGISFISH